MNAPAARNVCSEIGKSTGFFSITYGPQVELFIQTFSYRFT